MRQILMRCTVVGMVLFLVQAVAEAKTQGNSGHSNLEATSEVEGMHQGALEGQILGVSNKAQLVTIQLAEGIEFISFNKQVIGRQYLNKGEKVVVKFTGTNKHKTAVEFMPKLAQLPVGVQEILAEELVDLVDSKKSESYFLVDVRAQSKFQEGHIPTALSMPLLKMQDDIEGLKELAEDGREVIFYSNGLTCGLCTKAAEIAASAGITKVKVLLSGFRGWEDEGELMAVDDSIIQQGRAVLIDIRESAAVSAGHIPEAIGIPIAELGGEIEYELPSQRKAPIVLYGRDVDVIAAAKTIRAWGFSQIRQVDGGFDGWLRRGGASSVGKALTTDKISWAPVLKESQVAKRAFMKLAAKGSPDRIILDVRTEKEAKIGAFKNALHIPLEELADRLTEIPEEKGVVTHCASGERAEMAALYLSQFRDNVQYLSAKVRCKGEKCRVR